ncbi:MAG: exodeoxyribonuclease VII large subunit [Victivallales bacterium]|nr:exodeoxyribonuclease VII large subunit [Victivallales bacterium]
MVGEERQVWKVSEVNAAIRELVENSLMPFWLRGEVGTISIQRSGHVYLTLKDDRTQLKAVFFGGAAQARQFKLQPGVAVEAFGKLTVYEVRGEYQFSVRMLRPLGVGDLQRRFEELRVKLESEGLFAPERKRRLPGLPRRIGVVTSPDGAAIRDFLQIIDRRFPDIRIKIYPAPVQGEGAGEKLARGVNYFNRYDNVDVIVVTRGGGSMEDLWPFNSEELARAIAAGHLPVISAVGHEIDYTICDFVADLRAPTPSAAAELVIGQQAEIRSRLERLRKHLRQALELRAEKLRRRLDRAAGSYVFREPGHLVRQRQQQLDELLNAMRSAAAQYHRQREHGLAQLRLRQAAIRPQPALREQQRRLTELVHRQRHFAAYRLERGQAQLAQLSGRLTALCPDRVLQRGYAILTAADTGRIIASVAQATPGLAIAARLADGKITATVTTAAPADSGSVE